MQIDAGWKTTREIIAFMDSAIIFYYEMKIYDVIKPLSLITYPKT